MVYNDPKLGIYNNWPESSKTIIRFSGIIHKNFTNRLDFFFNFYIYNSKFEIN